MMVCVHRFSKSGTLATNLVQASILIPRDTSCSSKPHWMSSGESGLIRILPVRAICPCTEYRSGGRSELKYMKRGGAQLQFYTHNNKVAA